jgi:hypothetical protein
LPGLNQKPRSVNPWICTSGLFAFPGSISLE